MRRIKHPIKRARFEREFVRNLSQATEGTILGIPQPTLSAIENGKLLPSPSQLQRLSDFFGVPADELLKDVVIVEPRR